MQPAESSAEHPPAALPEAPFCQPAERRFVLVAAILASALGFIDGSVLAIAVPTIRLDLGASLTEAQWVSNAYALTLSALILVGGAAGDRFGLRRTFVFGIAFFVAASMACALAPDVLSLILFRAVQGVGAAVMVPCSLAIIAKAYPKKERGRAIGVWAAASSLTTALGPVIGGFMLSAFDPWVWRVIFAINLPLGGIAIWMLMARVPADRPAARRRLDLGGAALATFAFGALAFGLTSLGEGGGASRQHSLIFIAAGLALLGGFLMWERRHKDAMIDLRLFARTAFAGANAATFFLYFALSGILFYLPMLLIAGWGLNSAEVGFVFLPLSAAIALLSGPVGKLSDTVGPRLPIAGGSLLVGAAFAGLAAVAGAGFHGFWSAVFPLMALMGLGMALVVSPLSTAIMTSVEDKDTGSASGINNAVARMAGLVAVAAMGAVAAYGYAATLGGDLAAVPGFGEPVKAQLTSELEAARVAASDAAFAGVAWVTASLCFLSAVTAWLTVPSSTQQKT